MLKILLLAPSSYPVQHAEAIVNMKLLQCLTNSDSIEIDLISEEIGGMETYPSTDLDSYHIKLSSISIIPTTPIKDKLGRIRNLFRSMMISRKFWKLSPWCIAAYKRGKELCEKNKYDYILTKDRNSYLVGLLLKRHFNIPIVATWNDPYPEIYYPYPYTHKESILDKVFRLSHERAIRNQVDVNIFPSDRLRDYMIPRLKIDSASAIVVPHVVIPQKDSSECKHEKNHIRMILAGNNKKPRDPRNLISALCSLVKSTPEVSMTLDFVGPVDDDVKDLVKELSCERSVSFLGVKDYQSTMTLIKEYDVAIVLEADCEEGIFLPTKVTDYLQLGVRVFAISPKTGVLNDLYKQKCVSYFAPCDSVAEIQKELLRCWTERESSTDVHIPGIYLPDNIREIYSDLIPKIAHRKNN